MEEAKQEWLIPGFPIDNVDYEVNHLQFADDTIAFLSSLVGPGGYSKIHFQVV